MTSTSVSIIRNTLALSLLAALPLLAQAQEVARVISSTPVMTQIAIPRQVCTQSQMMVTPPKSGAGAMVGAVAGAALGNTIGGGSGRALTTAAGMIGGAMVGDSMTPSPPPVLQPVASCTHQITYENRISGYNVIYEYAGRQYSIQMPNDPGPYLPLQVSPSMAVAPAIITPAAVIVGPTVSAPVMVSPYPSQVWYGSPGYGYGYGSGVALRFGYGHSGHGGHGGRGGHGGGRDHHHWR